MGGCCSSEGRREKKEKHEEPLLKNEVQNVKQGDKDTDSLNVDVQESDERSGGYIDQDLVETKQKRSASESHLEFDANSHLNQIIQNNRNSIDELTFSTKLDDLRHIDSEVTVYDEHKLILRTDLFSVTNDQKASGTMEDKTDISSGIELTDPVKNNQFIDTTSQKVDNSVSTFSDIATEFDPRKVDATNPLETQFEDERNEGTNMYLADETMFEYLRTELVPQIQTVQEKVIPVDSHSKQKHILSDEQKVAVENLIQASVATNVGSSPDAPWFNNTTNNNESTEHSSIITDNASKEELSRIDLYIDPIQPSRNDDLITQSIILDLDEIVSSNSEESKFKTTKNLYEISFIDKFTKEEEEEEEEEEDIVLTHHQLDESLHTQILEIEDFGEATFDPFSTALKEVLISEEEEEEEEGKRSGDEKTISNEATHKDTEEEIVDAHCLSAEESKDENSKCEETKEEFEAVKENSSSKNDTEENKNEKIICEDIEEDFSVVLQSLTSKTDSYSEAHSLYFSPPEDLSESYTADNSEQENIIQVDSADEGITSLEDDSYSEFQTLYFSLSTEKSDSDASKIPKYEKADENNKGTLSNVTNHEKINHLENEPLPRESQVWSK